MLRETLHLIIKELQLELRHPVSLSSVLLFVISGTFIVYLLLSTTIEPMLWNALFWLVALFAAINAASHSFAQEHSYRRLYYYSLASPLAIIISKSLYNSLALAGIFILEFFLFSLLIADVVQLQWTFILIVFLAAIGLAFALTLISALASRTGLNFTLMAILSFPVVLPVLLSVVKLSAFTFVTYPETGFYKHLLALILIDLVIIMLTTVLFPYTWKD